MRNKRVWTGLIIIIIVLAGTGFFFRDRLTGLVGGQANAQTGPVGQTESTVKIRPAADSTQVSAAGNIALVSQKPAVFQVAGLIREVTVEVGDEVAAGDLLVALDTTDLERAVQQTRLALEVSKNQLEQLLEPANQADIDAARSSLASAQENLSQVQAGPNATELAAAQAALAAAQASYEELLAGASEAELTQLGGELHKAFITLNQAQEAYNEIAYKDTVGSSSQAMTLQQATIDYDVAKAAYEIATEPASPAELQDAQRAIKDAQFQLESLASTKADLAAAKAQVASAEAALADLLNGPSEAARRAAELTIEQTQLDLGQAEAQLALAELRAPADGTILTVDVEVGQQANAGLSAVTLTDLAALELTVNVAEVDVTKLQLGQAANITIDAIPDRILSGIVSRIAPSSASEGGVVNYPVTVRLNKLDLEGVRPGMTAVATILGDTSATEWLVPTNAVVEFEGETTVLIMRDGRPTRVKVTPSTSQGEWTVVQSAELRAGDEVVGQVASFLDQQNQNARFRGPFGGGGGRPPD